MYEEKFSCFSAISSDRRKNIFVFEFQRFIILKINEIFSNGNIYVQILLMELSYYNYAEKENQIYFINSNI